MRKALYILGDLDDTDLIWLARNGMVRRLDPGHALIREGQPVSDLFFVTDGRLVVSARGKGEVAELGLGDVVGEMSFVEKAMPSATVTTAGEARVLAVPRSSLLAAFAGDSGFAARFYRALAVFLSDRLRTVTTPPGGDAELDEALLDTLSDAGDRFLRLIALLEGRER